MNEEPDKKPYEPGCLAMFFVVLGLVTLGMYLNETPMKPEAFLGFVVIGLGVWLPCKLIVLACKYGPLRQRERTAQSVPSPTISAVEDRRQSIERAYKAKLDAIEKLTCPDERRDAKTVAERDYLQTIAGL
jgi:hypothetical protein